MLSDVVGVGKQLNEIGKELCSYGGCLVSVVELADDVYKTVKRLWKRGRERMMEWCCRAVYGETVRSDYEKCE